MCAQTLTSLADDIDEYGNVTWFGQGSLKSLRDHHVTVIDSL